jgi:hypothetical protein
LRSGHNPDRKQKKLLAENNKNWTEWLLVKTNVNTYVFKHKVTNEILELPKSE